MADCGPVGPFIQFKGPALFLLAIFSFWKKKEAKGVEHFCPSPVFLHLSRMTCYLEVFCHLPNCTFRGRMEETRNISQRQVKTGAVFSPLLHSSVFVVFSSEIIHETFLSFFV